MSGSEGVGVEMVKVKRIRRNINSSLSRSMSNSQPSHWRLLLRLIHLIGFSTWRPHLAQVMGISWSSIRSFVMAYREYKRRSTFLLEFLCNGQPGGVFFGCKLVEVLMDLRSSQRYNNFGPGTFPSFASLHFRRVHTESCQGFFVP